MNKKMISTLQDNYRREVFTLKEKIKDLNRQIREGHRAAHKIGALLIDEITMYAEARGALAEAEANEPVEETIK